MKKFPGNGMVEYALPAGILLVAIVGFTTAFPLNNPNALLQAYQGESLQDTANGKQMVMASYGKISVPSEPGMQPLMLTLQNGSVITLPGLPASITESLDTVGGNGTTERLLASLDALLADPKFLETQTPSQIATLKALSNQGHRLAGFQKVVEDLAKSSGTDKAAFMNTPVTFEGVTYSNLSKLTPLISFHSSDKPFNQDLVSYLQSQNFNINLPQNPNIGGELESFYQLYRNADQGQALKDPAVKALVQQLSNQIGLISDSLEDQWGAVNYGSASPDSLLKAESSALSHLDSTGICSPSGGSDSGIHCM